MESISFDEKSHCIYILIPTHDRAELLQRTVKSISRCIPPQHSFIRVLIVENGRKCGIESVVKSYAAPIKVDYFYHPQGNKSAALNAAISTLDDGLLIFLDDDVRVHEALLIEYEQAAIKNSSNCFFGGPMLVDYEIPPLEWLIKYLPPSAKGWSPVHYEGVCIGLWFMGCNWAAYSWDIKKAGLFCPKRGPGGTSGGTGQETAMQQALINLKLKPKYVLKALVWHYVPKSRCSVEWALERAYKNSISSGLNNSSITKGRTFMDIPLWLLRKRFELMIELFIKKFVASEEDIFLAKHALRLIDGEIKGIWLARRLKQH